VAIARTNQNAAGEKEIAGTRFVNFKSAAFVEALREHFGETLRHVAAQSQSRIENLPGFATKQIAMRLAAVEIPMAMMRRGGSAARVAFFGAAVSSMTAGGSMRPTRAWRLLFLQSADRQISSRWLEASFGLARKSTAPMARALKVA